MGIFGVRLCLSSVFVFVIVNTMIEGQRLRRRHNHHSHPNDYDFEESVPRNLPGNIEDESAYHDSYGEMERRGYSKDFDNSLNLDYEDMDDWVPSPHRYRHEYTLENFESSRRRIEKRKSNNYERSFKIGNRRKRHNGKHNCVSYRRITEQDRRDHLTSKQRDHELELLHSDENGGLHQSFELEVKQAQNSSICNYTIVSIPDTRGSRVPKDLEHVMCNHAGSSCQSVGTYCCIQTYRKIEVVYGDGFKETMKIYVGCVCALHDLRLTESPLPIHD